MTTTQPRILSEAEKAELRELRKQGVTGRELAARYGIETGTVYRLEKQAPNEAKRKAEAAGDVRHLTFRKRPEQSVLSVEERNALILEFTPVVKAVAKRIYWRIDRKVELEDLQQEGMLSLAVHAERHDPGRGIAFQCYVKATVRRDLWQYVCAGHLAPKKLKTRLKQASPVEIVSLDAPVSPESKRTGLDLLPGREPDPYATAERTEITEKVARAYDRLNPAQQRAIHLVFAAENSFSAAGRELGCSRDAIKQRIEDGITEIRSKLAVNVVGFTDLTRRSHRSLNELSDSEWEQIAALMATDTRRDWIAAKFKINRVALFTGYRARFGSPRHGQVLAAYRTAV